MTVPRWLWPYRHWHGYTAAHRRVHRLHRIAAVRTRFTMMSTTQLFQHFLYALFELRRVWQSGQFPVLFFWQDNDAPEKTSVDVGTDIAAMIVEWPGSHHLICDLVGVDPCLARTNLVRATTVIALGAERPGAIGIDSVAQSVEMEAMWSDVRIFDVDAQPITGLHVDYRAWHATRESWFIHIGGDELVRLRNEVLSIEVLAVD